jgi:signal transduction histidine kinase/ligand-binding sensor domain-containing protein
VIVSRLSRIACLLSTAMAVASPIAAAPPDWSLREYTQTTWTHRDGIPLAAPLFIRQTTDGYLWFTSERTLVRFDGVKFVAMPNLCGWVQAIEAGTNGSLWILCRQPTFRLLQRSATGHVIDVPLPDWPLGAGTGSAMFTDSQGRLWLFGPVIGRLEADGTFRELGRVPGVGARSMVEDSAGTFWLSSQPSHIRIQNDRLEYVPIPERMALASSRAGAVFGCEAEGVYAFSGTSKVLLARAPPGVRFAVANDCIRVDSSGALWVATRQHGIARISGGRVETISSPNEPGSATSCVFVDREDNIWVASTAGLHRFRKPHARLLSSLNVRAPWQPFNVFIDSRDNIWMRGLDEFVRVNPERGIEELVAGLVPNAIAEDSDGQIWVATAQEIGRLDGRSFRPVRDAAGAPVRGVQQFSLDANGHLWAVSRNVGVYQVTPGPPRRILEVADAAADLLVSSQSGTWVTTRNGVRQFTPDGKSVLHELQPETTFYAAQTLAEVGNAIWFGDTEGLWRWRGGQTTRWTRAHGLPASGGVQEITTDRAGRLWLMTLGGIVVLSLSELDAVPDGHAGPLRFVQIGALDRVVAHQMAFVSSPRIAKDREGRLYFATQDSVAIVDPSALVESSLRPTIVLESVLADSRALETATAARLTSPSKLEFDYTSLSLRSPENIRFRYKLEGHDADWIEAGGARQATYGALSPGAYTFRVIGSGSEGVWNEEGASYAFRIVPFFYNTWWFRTLALTVVAAAMVGTHRLRVRGLTRQMQVRFEERLAERTRIAQELHDTLLQGTLAASMHVQLANEVLEDVPSSPVVEEMRAPLRRATQLLTQVADEGRAAVSGLRSAPDREDLAQTLYRVAEDQPNDEDIAFRVTVRGTTRALKPEIVDEVGRIAREAVVNAYKHSRARAIDVELAYAPSRFTCIVRDDGQGIHEPVIDRGREGHWGLPGMRERAERVGGELHLRSSAAAGTEVELSLDGRLAYVADRHGSFVRWWRTTRFRRASTS